MKDKTQTQKETENIAEETLKLMKKMVNLKDQKMKESYLKSIKESHNQMLRSFDNEILEAITAKEITEEQAKEYFKNTTEK